MALGTISILVLDPHFNSVKVLLWICVPNKFKLLPGHLVYSSKMKKIGSYDFTEGWAWIFAMTWVPPKIQQSTLIIKMQTKPQVWCQKQVCAVKSSFHPQLITAPSWELQQNPGRSERQKQTQGALWRALGPHHYCLKNMDVRSRKCRTHRWCNQDAQQRARTREQMGS